jgi:DNA-binding transcriptional LysR family regulator
MVVESREIEAFLAVAEELHFGRAAERLRVSTSRVSQMVRALERRVGGPLFERSSRRVRLTTLGEQLLTEVRPAYQRLEQALRDVRQTSGQGVEILRVGFASPVPKELPPRLIGAFERERPGCRVVSSTHPSTDLYRWLEEGQLEVDVLVTWLAGDPVRVPGRLCAGPVVRREPRGITVGERHPLAGRAHVDVEELAGYDVLYPGGHHPDFADDWAPGVTPAGHPIRRVHRDGARYVEEMQDLLAAGDLVHVTVASMPTLFPAPGTVTIPLSGLPPIAYMAVWLPEAETAAVRGFAEVAARVGAAGG